MDKIKTTLDADSRRAFLRKSGIVLLGSTLAYQAGAFGAIGSVNKSKLKVGLIGCGGRGTGAAVQAMHAEPNVEITAMGDVFEDRLEEAYQALLTVSKGQVKVDKKNKFIGIVLAQLLSR